MADARAPASAPVPHPWHAVRPGRRPQRAGRVALRHPAAGHRRSDLGERCPRAAVRSVTPIPRDRRAHAARSAPRSRVRSLISPGRAEDPVVGLVTAGCHASH